MPPGPRQRRATKIANRSKVTPFDRLAQWNAQIMNLGPQGAIPSIVGNSLEFVKLNASSIPGVMDNPATEDLIMGPWDILFDTGGNINMTNGMISGVQNLNSSGNLTLSALTSINIGSNSLPNITLSAIQTNINGQIIDLSGDQVTIDAGNAGINIGSDKQIYMDAVGGDIELNSSSKIKLDAVQFVELSGNQVCIDAGGGITSGGVNIGSDAKITMDAATNIDIEAVGVLDLSGNQMTINSTNNLEVKAGATLGLSSTNSTLNGTSTVDITGTTINIGTSSSTVDISGQITINNVVDLAATDITATGTIQGATFTTGTATGNTITTQGIVTGGAITDGTATMSSGTITGLLSLTSGTISDGIATLNNGSMTGLVDVSTNSITLKNTKFTSTSETRDVSNAPYVWGVNYLEQIDPTDIYLLGNYKQIRSALFIWSGTEIITFNPPDNTGPAPAGIPSVQPPCQTGGELLKLGTPQIWDLPTANYQAGFDTFTIPHLACRTMMTVELSVDIFYPHVNNAPLPDPPNYIDRVNVIRFWLGKNAGPATALDGGESGPMAYRLSTLSPAYFGTNANQPTYSHYASTTLMGGESLTGPPGTPQFEFRPGDTFYLTAQQSGTAGMFSQLKNIRVKVTWEALN
jgi:hypothetical protein